MPKIRFSRHLYKWGFFAAKKDIESIETFVEEVNKEIGEDGIHFTDTGTQVSDGCYLRVIPHEGYLYSFEQLGQVRRTKTGVDVFEKGPVLFRRWDQRHLALLKRDDTLDY